MRYNNFETASFKFEVYDKKNVEHVNLMEDIRNDAITDKYVPAIYSDVLTPDKYTDYGKNLVKLGFVIKADDHYIGAISLCHPNNYVISFRRCLAPQYRHMKYGRRMLAELIDYLYNKCGFTGALMASVDKGNDASRRSLEALGFQPDPYTTQEPVIDYYRKK